MMKDIRNVSTIVLTQLNWLCKNNEQTHTLCLIQEKQK